MRQNDAAEQKEWIYDWNLAAAPLIAPGTHVLLNDETLRDGLQNPSVHDPGLEEKIEILHLMEALGIDSLNIGLPGAGARAVEHVEALAREIVTRRMKIKPNCAARTIEADIRNRFAYVPLLSEKPDHATFYDVVENFCPIKLLETGEEGIAIVELGRSSTLGGMGE